VSADFLPAHETRSATIRLHAPPERAFPLFEPEGERAWAPGWDPRFLHPRDCSAEEGAVFVTRADGRETIWMITAYRPPSRIRYARITPGFHAVTVEVELTAEAAETHARVSYTLTALTPAGNDAVAEMVAGYDGWMVDWQQRINAALLGG
jgi:hypothetical protein